MSKRLIISEEEKSKILKLYGLKSKFINEEDTPQQQGNKKTIEIPVYFESGCWSNTGGQSCTPGQVDTAFQPYIQQIKDYIATTYKGKPIEVVLSASESKVPNRNAEKPKIKVESGAYVHPRLKPGVLSSYRYNTIQTYLKKVFDDMVAAGEIASVPEFVKSEILIGGPDWKSTDSADDPKFKEHQYLKAIIKLKPRDPGPLTECLTDLLIGYDYDEVVRKNNSHYCDWGRFEVDANGIKLNRLDGKPYASVNNYEYSEIDTNQTQNQQEYIGTDDVNKGQYNFRYNRFKIDGELAKQIVSKDPTGDITITTKGIAGPKHPALWPNKKNISSVVHVDAARVTITNSKGEIFFDSCAGSNCTQGSEGTWTVTPEQYCKTTTAE
jgi:hypothetical protein